MAALDCAGCDGYNYNDQDWGKQVRCLRCEVQSLKSEVQGLGRETRSFTSELGKSNQIFGDMLSTIGAMRKRMYEFTTSTSQQYELAEKIAEAYKEVGLSIGLSVERSKGFSQAFKGSVAEIARFGGTIDDAARIYEEFAESSGRVRILGKDEVKEIYQLGKAANLVGSESAALFETFDLMGVGFERAGDYLENLIKESQSIGLNSSKVMKVLSQNMGKMQTFSFANGVQGMTQMAKLAVKMRMDVGDMLGMAEKFYEPEAAIEAAANLQMLGGDIAKAFGDPFETMYLARNKPEELAEKVGSMVENMVTFNEKTGEYEFPAEARMQLKAAGDQLGINVDKMIEMARQSAKIGDVKDKLSMKGMFSEEEMESIGSMARMSKDGGFVVDIYDENGEKQTKAIEDLTSGDLKMLVQPPKDEQDYMTKMIDNSMTTNQLLKSIEDTFQKSFIEGFDVYQLLEDGSKETIKATRDMTKRSLEGAMEVYKTTMMNEIGGLAENELKATDKAMADYINSLGSLFLDENPDMNIDVKDAIISIGGVTTMNPTQNQGNNPSTDMNPAAILQKKKDFCANNGSTYDESTGLCLDGTTPQFATGGIVTKPMKAIVGEGGEPEAIFPLSKLETFIQNQKMGGKVTLEGNPTITLNINSNGSDISFSEQEKMKMKDSIISVVTKMFNNGGSPDGSNIPQGSKGYIQTMG
jgi:hypothetical protein